MLVRSYYTAKQRDSTHPTYNTAPQSGQNPVATFTALPQRHNELPYQQNCKKILTYATLALFNTLQKQGADIRLFYLASGNGLN